MTGPSKEALEAAREAKEHKVSEKHFFDYPTDVLFLNGMIAATGVWLIIYAAVRLLS